MEQNRVFRIALVVSLATHAAILMQHPRFNLFNKLKQDRDWEVRYINVPKASSVDKNDITPAKEPEAKIPSRIHSQKTVPQPLIDVNKEQVFNNSEKISFNKPFLERPSIEKPDIISVKKKITIPPIDIDRLKGSSYVSYYQIVREKIKRIAYRHYNTTDVGDVYITFILSHDGVLKNVRLVEEKSSSGRYLKDVALRSITDASPFPVFPKSLDYPQLTFNVIISFEVE